MTKQRKGLLLIGSPRQKNSTSLSLGEYLCEKLREKGFSIEIGFIYRLMMRKEKQKDLLAMVNKADLIILSFPLYVDQLPSLVIRALELLYKRRNSIKSREKMKFLAICNCGFPEAIHNSLALEICHNFSDEMNFQWRGGIKKGGGEMIHGKDLKGMGRMVQELRKGLDAAAEAIINEENVPTEVINQISKDLIPEWIYRSMGNLGWRVRGLKNRNVFNLKDRPYSQ